MPDIINHVHQENYIRKMREKELKQIKLKKSIFKEAKSTKAFGLKLKALETFKKNYDEQLKEYQRHSLNKSAIKQPSPTKLNLIDPKTLYNDLK